MIECLVFETCLQVCLPSLRRFAPDSPSWNGNPMPMPMPCNALSGLRWEKSWQRATSGGVKFKLCWVWLIMVNNGWIIGITIYLVGGLEHEFDFPNWRTHEPSFFRGVGIPWPFIIVYLSSLYPLTVGNYPTSHFFWLQNTYPPVNVYITLENHHAING